MQEIDLLNLDIRLIDPLYGRKYFVPDSVKKNDFALFYRDNSNMKVLLIENGGRIFKKAISSVFDKYSYKPPIIEQPHYEIVQHMLGTEEPEHIRYSKDKFRTKAEQFVRAYALGRLESEIDSAEVYNANNALEEPCGDESDPHDNLVEKLQQDIIRKPELLHLPKTPKVVYREVRLSNRFSRCISTHDDYNKFRQEEPYTNSRLAQCDLVPHFSDTEFCIVEVKIGYSLNSKIIKKGQAELVKESLFYQENFQNPNLWVMALLKLGNRKKNFTVYHFQYDGQKLYHRGTFPPTPYNL